MGSKIFICKDKGNGAMKETEEKKWRKKKVGDRDREFMSDRERENKIEFIKCVMWLMVSI